MEWQKSSAADAARQFCASTPLPGQAVDGDEYEELQVAEDGEILDGNPGT